MTSRVGRRGEGALLLAQCGIFESGVYSSLDESSWFLLLIREQPPGLGLSGGLDESKLEDESIKLASKGI